MLTAIEPYTRYLKVGAMLLIILLACLTTHKCTADGYKLQLERKDRAAVEALVRVEQKARKIEQDWQAAADLISAQGYAALQEKERENDRLRDAVDAGTVRLRVAAKCPARLPEAAPGGPVDTAGGAELDAPARRHYHALRSGIVQLESRLSACQATLRADRE